MLNVVLFGMTAKEWRDTHPKQKGNIRDTATIQQLLVLANMESYNAILIGQGMLQAVRMESLRKLAVSQFNTLKTLDISLLSKLEENYDKKRRD